MFQLAKNVNKRTINKIGKKSDFGSSKMLNSSIFYLTLLFLSNFCIRNIYYIEMVYDLVNVKGTY